MENTQRNGQSECKRQLPTGSISHKKMVVVVVVYDNNYGYHIILQMAM